MNNEDIADHGLPPNPYNPHAWFVGDPQIGEGCWIGAFTIIDGSGGLIIGEGCDISSGAHIYTHSTVRRVISERTIDTERAPTRIGANVHVGAGAIVLMGCNIGNHSVIGAGAIVPQHTVAPPFSLLVGSPARIIENGARRYLAVGPQRGTHE